MLLIIKYTSSINREKSFRARGRRVTTWSVDKVEELEPLRQPEPEIPQPEPQPEEEPEESTNQNDNVDENGQMSLFQE